VLENYLDSGVHDGIDYWPTSEVRILQSRLLSHQVDLCLSSHPYYADELARAGVCAGSVASIDDLVALPLTTKATFVASPDRFRLQAEEVPVVERTLWDVVYTTGTTSGVPAPIYATTSDYYLHLQASVRNLDLLGVRRADVVALLFPLTNYPTAATARIIGEAAVAGASVVLAMPGRQIGDLGVHRTLEDVIVLVRDVNASVLMGHATFVRRLLKRAAEYGTNLPALRMCTVTGEPASDALREDIRRLMTEVGASDTAVINRYGSTEAGVSMIECTPGTGYHDLTPDQVLCEVVDPDSGRRVDDGEEGSLAVTHLVRRGTVLLRYLVGDIVSGTHEPCPECGRTVFRITGGPRRLRDVVKIKGTLVNVASLEDEVLRIAGVEDFQIIVRPPPADPMDGDEMIIRVVSASQSPQMLQIVTDAVEMRANVRPKVEFASVEAFLGGVSAEKVRRFVDER